MAISNSPFKRNQVEGESRFHRSIKFIEAAWATLLILCTIAGSVGAVVYRYNFRLDKLEWDMADRMKADEKMFLKLDNIGTDIEYNRTDISEIKGYLKRLAEKGL